MISSKASWRTSTALFLDEGLSVGIFSEGLDFREGEGAGFGMGG